MEDIDKEEEEEAKRDEEQSSTTTAAREEYDNDHPNGSARSKEQRRGQIAEELLATEKAYVEQLILIRLLFIQPMRERNGRPAMVPEKYFPVIFGNIEDIFALNKELLRLLLRRMRSDEFTQTGCIGDVLLRICPFFKIYSLYAQNYSNAVATIQQLQREYPTFHDFLKARAKDPEFNGLHLTAFLLTPVQRIPRYRLLFEDLLRNTEPSHADYPNLKKAVESISDIASFVNTYMKEQDDVQQLLAIQKSFVALDEPLLVPGRKYVKEGVLMKQCRKTQKPRMFFLFSDVLIYGAATNSAVPGVPAYVFHQRIPMEELKVVPKEDKDAIQNRFLIISQSKSFTVFAESEEEKNAWIAALKETSETFRSRNRSLSLVFSALDKSHVENSFEAPVWVPDSEATRCMVCNTEFTMVRRRHHCRYCGKVVCSKCSPTRDMPWLPKSKQRARICDPCFVNMIAPKSPDAGKTSSASAAPNSGAQPESPSPPAAVTAAATTATKGDEEKGAAGVATDSDYDSSDYYDEDGGPAGLPPSSSSGEAALRRTGSANRAPAEQPSSAEKQSSPEKSSSAAETSEKKLKLPKKNRISMAASEMLRRATSTVPKFDISHGQLEKENWHIEKSGFLHKRSLLNKKWTRLWVVLVTQPHADPTVPFSAARLLWFPKYPDREAKPSGWLDLQEVILFEEVLHEGTLIMKLITAVRMFYLSAQSEENQADWAAIMSKVVTSLQCLVILQQQPTVREPPASPPAGLDNFRPSAALPQQTPPSAPAADASNGNSKSVSSASPAAAPATTSSAPSASAVSADPLSSVRNPFEAEEMLFFDQLRKDVHIGSDDYFEEDEEDL